MNINDYERKHLYLVSILYIVIGGTNLVEPTTEVYEQLLTYEINAIIVRLSRWGQWSYTQLIDSNLHGKHWDFKVSNVQRSIGLESCKKFRKARKQPKSPFRGAHHPQKLSSMIRWNMQNPKTECKKLSYD